MTQTLESLRADFYAQETYKTEPKHKHDYKPIQTAHTLKHTIVYSVCDCGHVKREVTQ